MNFDVEVDASGLKCPLPILRTKKALATMLGGQVLKVISTDAASASDFALFGKQTGNSLLHTETSEDGVWVFYLQRRL